MCVRLCHVMGWHPHRMSRVPWEKLQENGMGMDTEKLQENEWMDTGV